MWELLVYMALVAEVLVAQVLVAEVLAAEVLVAEVERTATVNWGVWPKPCVWR